MLLTTPEETAASLALGLLPHAEGLPALATHWLLTGRESPSTATLSVAGSAEGPREREELLRASLRELGVTMPPTREAAETMKRCLARAIVDGVLSPEAGAFQIIYDVYLPHHRPIPGAGFGSDFGIGGLAGAYYSLDEVANKFGRDPTKANAEIIDAAREILAR